MTARPLRHIRHNAIIYLAFVLAVAAGGGYAVAATNDKTIHGCVSKRTHALYLQKRCHRSQESIAWNQRGPQGPQGAPGQPGPPASTAWATVGSDGSVSFGQGKNISAQDTGVGTYATQVAASACPNNVAAPVVTAWGAPVSGTFPVASIVGGARSFTVYTGTVGAGGFAASDGTFNVSVSCS
jgi:hypothetical protein